MTSFKTTYKTEAEKGIARLTTMPPLVENDLVALPDVVQNYLRYTGALGQPQVQNMHAAVSGRMKLTENGRWMQISAEQYNFFDQPTRLFYISSRLFGVPFAGLHRYCGDTATMNIKLASLIPVVDASGPLMTKGETVTLFNDMCVLAPATLIDQHIHWESIDPLTVRATFANQGYTISAVLFFNEKGELVNFVSDDRYQTLRDNTFANVRWSTPVKDYKDINGHTLASYGEAVWHMPKGEFVYAQYHFTTIEYNVQHFAV
jgi:hypothetical protein